VPLSERLKRSRQLSELLLAPLGEQPFGRRTLVFVPDAALHYVPFAALRLGFGGRERFLIESHDIAIAPSVRMYLSPEPRHAHVAPTRQMLLVADPVYELSDARLAKVATNAAATSGASARTSADDSLGAKLLALFRGADAQGTFARLPGTADEAAAIAALLPASSVDRLEGFTATRDRFLGAGLDRYRFIHIATHAVADAEVPQASALILSRFDARSRELDGNVLAADFVPLQLNAQTVVLSACDTALGKNVAGEGLIGLRYVVLARGAESVVSSLWPIADQVTAQVMTQFYPLLLNGTRVEAALSAAMRKMLAGPFSDPAWWSAFTLTVRTQ
jgi:CHAT domain-containing protein